MNRIVLFVLAGLAALAPAAHAEWEFLPESRHQQFLTYGLFIDDQSQLTMSTKDAQAWGAIAETVALLEKTDWDTRPQLVLHASANAGFAMTQGHTVVMTQTIDARVSLAGQWAWSDSLRAELGWMHESGHIADNIPNVELIGPNVGFELLFFRVIKDIDERYRLGATLKPFIGSDPGMETFGADQFAEWYPWGTASSEKKPTPFIAGGFEQYGRNRIYLTSHVAIGAYVGNHLRAEHKPAMRAQLGYYTGVDPRLKYASYKALLTNFGYAGLEFDL